jgi:flagellar protein FliO/FliZ
MNTATPGPGFGALLWFVAILAAIPLVLWLLKRSPIGGAMGQHVPGAPRPVAVLPLGPQQKLVTVEVGQGEERVWLVLGVAPNEIRTLHTMSPSLPPAPEGGANPAAATFSQLLGRMKNNPPPPGGAQP